MGKAISERQKAILTIVKNQGFVSTEQLVGQFNVTPQTIRRDINILCDQSLMHRFHGGAGQATSIENEAYHRRLHAFVEAKSNIARHVAKHIPNGSSLFLNIGTTTEMVAQALIGHKNLKIVTNNLHVATILSNNDDFEVMIAGGQLRNRDGGITGPATTEFIQKFRLDFGVIGVSGIDSDGSLLDFDYQETRNAEAIIANSRETILVADHSKFGRRAMSRFGHLSQIDWLFTDQELSEEFQSLSSASGVAIKICHEPEQARVTKV
ncbi:MAG: DeoR family transcriptional regulator [Sphingopyxis sp.]|nr:DeoR family transcriptional regulator [Sphingopyxis sp.]